MRFPKAYADLAARLRVPLGFVLAAAFIWLAEPSPFSLALALPVSMAGLLLRGWAAGHLAKNEALAESGPYAWVRNPLYLGTSIVAAGLAIASRRLSLALLFAAALIFVYLPVVELEEGHLRKLFPSYAGYERRVSRFLPKPPAHQTAGGFRWSLYLRNEEYNALMGFLAAAAYLVWRAF